MGGLAEECAMPEDDELLDGFPTDEQLDNFLLVPSRSCGFSHRCLNVYLTFYKDGHCHTISNAPAFFQNKISPLFSDVYSKNSLVIL